MKVKLSSKPGGFGEGGKIQFVKALRQMTGCVVAQALAALNHIEFGKTVEVELDETQFGEQFFVWDAAGGRTEHATGIDLLTLWVNVYDVDGKPLSATMPAKPTASLPPMLAALISEADLVIEGYGVDSRQMLGFDADKPVTWKRGRADDDCIGMRAVRLVNTLGPTRMVREFIEAAIKAAQADGLSEPRATSTVGVSLIMRLWAGKPSSFTAPTPQQVLVEHAAQLIEAGELS